MKDITKFPIPDSFPSVPDLPGLLWEETVNGPMIRWRNAWFYWDRRNGWRVTMGHLSHADDKIFGKALEKLA